MHVTATKLSILWTIFSMAGILMLGSKLYAQQTDATILTEELPAEAATKTRAPINIDLAIGYQSNLDLIDRNLYEVKYTDNSVMNINTSTNFNYRIFGKPLAQDTSFNSEFVYSDTYDQNSDFIRRATLKNGFFVNLLEGNEHVDFGPTLNLNLEKRYTRPGWYRKRDNANATAGLKAVIKASSALTVTPEASVGYLDHNGTYVPPIPPRFAYERNFEEDRVILKSALTTAYTFNKFLSITVPVSLNRDIYKERRARFAKDNIDAYHAMALAQWTQEAGLPFQDPTLDLQTFSSGVTADINLNEANIVQLGYTYIDERERNIGHRFSDTDNDVINVSLTTAANETTKISLGYENYDTRFYRLWGGGKEITQTYSAKLSVANFLGTDVKGVFNFSYADYQLTLPNIAWQERASNSTASIGIATSI